MEKKSYRSLSHKKCQERQNYRKGQYSLAHFRENYKKNQNWSHRTQKSTIYFIYFWNLNVPKTTFSGPVTSFELFPTFSIIPVILYLMNMWVARTSLRRCSRGSFGGWKLKQKKEGRKRVIEVSKSSIWKLKK